MQNSRIGSSAATRDMTDRWAVARQVAQVTLAGLVAPGIVGVATAVASERFDRREAIGDARTTTLIKAQSLVEPAIRDGLGTGDAAAVKAVDEVVRAEVLDDDLVRVKVWTRDGRIVYSDEPRLVGQSYALGEEEVDAVDSGVIEAEVSDLAAPENAYERDRGKLLEVPGTAALLEESAAAVRDSIKSLRTLLVDIYPPKLAEAGLPAALTDLLASVATRGTTASTAPTPSVLPAPSPVRHFPRRDSTSPAGAGPVRRGKCRSDGGSGGQSTGAGSRRGPGTVSRPCSRGSRHRARAGDRRRYYDHVLTTRQEGTNGTFSTVSRSAEPGRTVTRR